MQSSSAAPASAHPGPRETPAWPLPVLGSWPGYRVARMTQDDAEDWARFALRADVQAQTSASLRHVDELRPIIDRGLADDPQAPVLWCVREADSGALVASFGFHTVSAVNGTAEVTYLVHPDLWGRGLATAVCRAAVDWAFDVRGWVRVQATTLETNPASRRVLEKCGFQREGLLRRFRRVRGEPRDYVLHAIVSPAGPASVVTTRGGRASVDDPRIRPLVPADAAPYRALMLHAYATDADAYTSTPQDRADAPLSWWADRIAHPRGDSVGFGAWVGGELVGTVTVEFSRKVKTAHEGLVIGMYLLPVHRGSGLARALMGAAMAHAQARPGTRSLFLTVTDGNLPAERLYRSLGFEVVGAHPAAIATPGGLRTKLLMWRALAPLSGGTR